MNRLWNKLNLKDQDPILILNAPKSFEAEVDTLDQIQVLRTFGRSKSISFVIAFVTKQAEINKAISKIAVKCDGDVVLWFAYPKKSSKNLSCDFDRDNGWEAVGQAGFEGVRQVAIDADWSALRFRRVEFIKTLQRNPQMAISKVGKARTKKQMR